jgi:phage terminase large subunit GpA-like protein
MTNLAQPDFKRPLSAEQEYRQAFAAGLLPDEVLTVSQWADAERKLDSRGSPEPGDWRTDRTPYLREIMDNLSVTSGVEESAVMKAAQLGFTEAGNNLVGYVIHHAPGPGLFLEPSQDLANRNVRQKINPMIESTPALAERVPKARSATGGNTLEEKEFPGGIWMFKWASSTAGLRSATIRFLVMDEIDEYAVEIGQQGDPEMLARARTNAYGRRKKIYIPSTPTVEGHSRIADLFEDSDQRRFYMPCPCCGQSIRFEFKQLKWVAGDPSTAHYECQRCFGKIHEWQKTEMLERGEWVAENPENTRRRGYHINGLYSPVGWLSWAEIAELWEDAQGNPGKLKVFVNTVLAETWKERGEAPDWKRLYERREDYQLGVVPRGGLIITAAADVQRGPDGAGWIEVVTYAWGRNLERWVIDHRQFHGDTSDISIPGGPWEQLQKLRESYYPHEHSGVAMPITMMAVDSGDQTMTVYDWCASQPHGTVMAVKGQQTGSLLISNAKPVQIKQNGKRKARATKLWLVSLNIAKAELFAQLRYVRDPEKPLGRGYIHFPELDQEFFEQLTGEQMLVKRVKGRQVSSWEPTRSRVEVLDCTVYARAAAYLLGIDGWSEENWLALEESLGIVGDDGNQTPADKPQRRKSNYWNRR